MVLSSISPLFILWGILGNKSIPDRYFATACCILVVFPNGFLYWRLRTAKRLREVREIVVGRVEDHRDHLLVYLFTMLLPLYPLDMGSPRNLLAAIVALGFIVFLFWHLDLHYMNLFFAVKGFRVFTVYPPRAEGELGSQQVGHVVLSRSETLERGRSIIAYRLSDTVLIEKED